MSSLEMCTSTSLSCEDLIYESSKNKTNIQTTVRMLYQAIWWGDTGRVCGNDDYLILHSPRILPTASHNYPSKVTPENLL